MTKQSYFPMPHHVTIELLKEMIKPGEIPLGSPFGFFQPNNDEQAYLGSCYGEIGIESGTTWEDLFREMDLKKFDLDTLKGILKSITEMYKMPLKTALDQKIGSFDCIVSNEEIHASWSELDNLEKCQIRLRTLWINTGIELHNWACSIGDYIAEQHMTFQSCDWRVYEASNSQSEILSEILENYPDDISFLYISSSDNGGDKPYCEEKFAEKIDDISEWIEQYQDQYDDTEKDLTFLIFGLDLRDWQKKEILPVIAESIRELESAWIDGDLKLTLSDDMPQTIKDFLSLYNASQLLPGFDNVQ